MRSARVMASRDFRGDRARLPHHHESNDRYSQTERFHLCEMSKHSLKRDVVIEAANIPQLHEKEERRCCILQASHNWMRRKSD